MGAADRLFAQALDVERHFLLALRDQHPGVEHARLEHRAQPSFQKMCVHLRDPRTDRAAIVVEHANQCIGEIAGVGGRGIDWWLFFLLLARPLRSTLFPYTSLRLAP